MIYDNYFEVKKNIDAACKRSGRDLKDVTLITVSKTKPISDLEEAYEAGSRDFGENKVQELDVKIPAMPKDINWHMIGHLQRNKVKNLIGQVELIHSVDSLRLAEEISKESLKKNLVTDILIEVNVAEEETKFGLSLSEVDNLLSEIDKLMGVYVRGLMTIAPYVEDAEENRPIFRKLKQLSVDIDCEKYHNVSMDFLSMGMTGDYIVAVEEGATHVRVGTGIFGERVYN